MFERMSIDTRPLAFGGPPVSRLGLGLAALGRPAYINVGHGDDFPEARDPEVMERRAHEVLDAARAAGVTYLDAARSYGRAEAFLRSWLDARRIAPGAVVVGSKWGYRYVGGWQLDAPRHEVKDHSLAAFRSQLAETRGLLGPYLALYQIHSATPESGVLDDAAVLDALAALRDAGVRVGVTVSGPRQADEVRRALAVRRGGSPLFAAVQATWNVLERSCEEALREARAAGRTVIVKEVLANGRLTARGDAGRDGPLALLARDLGVGPDAVAVAAALARPWADVVLLGAASAEQLRSNLRALEVKPGPALLLRLDRLRVDPAAYWSARAALPWT
jgi:aryl-alcohol dehydrogenase-like predicted oxidoreductase